MENLRWVLSFIVLFAFSALVIAGICRFIYLFSKEYGKGFLWLCLICILVAGLLWGLFELFSLVGIGIGIVIILLLLILIK